MPEADTPGGARTGGMATARLVLASPREAGAHY
jgi:hypothetical protein